MEPVKKWPVFVHEGVDFPAKVKVAGGVAWLDEEAFQIQLDDRFITVGRSSIEQAEIYMRGGGSVVRLVHTSGTLYFAVTRLMIGGSFAIINRLATHRLHEALADCVLHA